MAYSNYLIFKMSRRYAENDQPSDLYDAAYEKLADLAPPWGLQGIPKVAIKEFRGEAAIGIKYTKVEKSSPIKEMRLGYMNRSRTALPGDDSMYDDTFTVEFYPKKVKEDWKYLLDVVFPAYVSATSPYFGRIYDGEIHVDDVITINEETGDSSRNVDYVDSRQGIYRIWPANYWDRELCLRSFRLTPEEIVQRLSGKVGSCRIFEGGVLLICSYDLLLGADIVKLNDVVLPLLRKPDEICGSTG